MKKILFLAVLLIAGCTQQSNNSEQSTNNPESTNESANGQLETVLATRYSATTNWQKNLSRHGTNSTVFSIDVQKALTSTSPILFTAHLHDIFKSPEGFTKPVANLISTENLYYAPPANTNGVTYAEFTKSYKTSQESDADTDFGLDIYVELNDEQVQRLLSTPDGSRDDEYAVIVRVSKVESMDSDDDYPTLYVEGTCVDFSLLK